MISIKINIGITRSHKRMAKFKIFKILSKKIEHVFGT